ncbi:centrosomal protein of 128 kDa-like isoform X2 [Acanthaster planci]|uniref:Centrosomal protein of 128 kDa-like isoform X2 n=1 Tax=Acanthaster planci TaxID=133434 RepID=A0A8B7YQU6_ACAPL|nr:centrosomal protein of 128 kDa-like isoform X2 [Acanthaster planci]
MSSDSDGYEPSDSSTRPRVIRARHPRSSSSATDDVQVLTSSLRSTSRNLNAVDGLLGHYRDSNKRQNAAIERLRDNLARSTESLRQERLNRLSSQQGSPGSGSRPLRASDLRETSGRRKYQPTSPHDDYTITRGSKRLKGRHMRRPSVKFTDELDEIHDIHETVRDLSDNQIRLEQDLDQAIQLRNQDRIDSQKALQELSDSVRQSQRKEEEQKSSQRVDKKLQAIQEELRQHRIHQEAQEKRKKETGQLSVELKQAIAAQSKQEEKEMRERLLKAETEKQQLTVQLETAQRKLDRAQGVKAAMQDQIEDYKNRLRFSDHERSIMQDRFSDLQESMEQEGLPLSRTDRKHQRLQETIAKEEKDRQVLEGEIQRLKAQLTQSQSKQDHQKYQRELERSEKQRDQLSQHLESVTKELENKERHAAKLVTDLQDASENLKASQEHEKIAVARLKELEKRLADGDRKAERQEERLLELERLLEEARYKKDDMRTKAKDKIRQWKLKCAKLQRDADTLKRRLSQAVERNQHLLTDNESHRTLNGTSTHRLDSLQREINDTLEKRAQQDEQLRLKDIEINELKSVRKDLELELRDTRNFMDKLDNELRAHQVRYNVLADEKLRLEEDLNSFKTKTQLAEDHMQKLQSEWHKSNAQKTELSAQLAEESGSRRVAEAHIRQLTQDIKIAKEDADRLTQQLKQEKRDHEMNMEELQKENEEKKSQGERMIMDRSNRLKRERAEMEAELQTLKLEIADSQSQLKTLRRQLEESRSDAEKAKTELMSAEQENGKLRRKYERAKTGYQEQAQLAEVENIRASNLEKRLIGVSSQLMDQDLENESVLHAINQEVDRLVEVCAGQDEVHRAISSPTRDVKHKPQHWLTEIKGKLQWVEEEMSRKLAHQRKLRQDLERSRTDADEVARYGDLQNRLLRSELDKQSGLLHELEQNNQDLVASKRQKDIVVKSLEKQVDKLEHHIEMNVKSLRRSLELIPDLDSPPRDSPAQDYKKLKDLQEERDRINDRYNRYKGTVTLLQQQLEEAKQSTGFQSPGTSPLVQSYKGNRISPASSNLSLKKHRSPETDSRGRHPAKGLSDLIGKSVSPSSKKRAHHSKLSPADDAFLSLRARDL